MNRVLNAPVFADIPKTRFVPGPPGTHITIRGLT
ncbi:MAG: ABC transporter ATP-binding protein, partial [Betaproteobacteria bacterium]|nr:ABC transporter ATP-binding protein [Betaproteobacteria bacterium]